MRVEGEDTGELGQAGSQGHTLGGREAGPGVGGRVRAGQGVWVDSSPEAPPGGGGLTSQSVQKLTFAVAVLFSLGHSREVGVPSCTQRAWLARMSNPDFLSSDSQRGALT